MFQSCIKVLGKLEKEEEKITITVIKLVSQHISRIGLFI